MRGATSGRPVLSMALTSMQYMSETTASPTGCTMPAVSLRSDNPEETAALRDWLYIIEVERKARIVNDSIARAWTRAMSPDTAATDGAVWSDLQADNSV